jgi:hypothetical protein
MQDKSLASIRSQPAVVKMNCRKEEKISKTNKEQILLSPDIASLYRFILQQKLPAMPKGLFSEYLFLLSISSY